MIAIKGILSTLSNLFLYLWRQKRWWLIPLVVLLVLFGVLIILGSATGVGPFIYTIF
jgi:hypothetical protein